MSQYQRDSALDYARRFWNVACDDLCVAIGHEPWFRRVPAGTVFMHTPDYQNPEYALLPGGVPTRLFDYGLLRLRSRGRIVGRPQTKEAMR